MPQSQFTTYKDDSGHYRWLMITSNSYQDRDGEWLTQVAHEKDVDRMNETVEYGTLDWWHTKLKNKDGRAVALDIGDCDHAVMLGRFRLESGTYRDESTGEAFASTDKQLRASLEFAHPRNEPHSGEYHHIRTIRRSVLPADRPANTLTGFATSKKETLDMNAYERLKAMQKVAGVDATLKAIADVMELDSTAKSEGIKAKSFDLATADLDELHVMIESEKARREKEATDSTPNLSTAVEFDEEAIKSMVKEAVTDAVAELGDRLEAVVTHRTKEQVESDRKATDLESKIKELQTQYNDLVNPSTAVDRATNHSNGGYRPSQQNPVTAQKEQAGTDGLATLANDLLGGGN